jgi:hypothetical protein
MKLLRIFADTILHANISLSDMRHIPYEKTENDLDFYKTTYNANGFWDQVTIERYHSENYPKIVLLEMQNSSKTLVRVRSTTSLQTTSKSTTPDLSRS